MPKFKSDTQAAIKEAFSFFAEHDVLPEEKLLPAVRALGLPITGVQMSEAISLVLDADGRTRSGIGTGSSITTKARGFGYDAFNRLMLEIVHKRKPETLSDEIRKAFEALKEDGSGHVLKKYLINLLSSTGDSLSRQEVCCVVLRCIAMS